MARPFRQGLQLWQQQRDTSNDKTSVIQRRHGPRRSCRPNSWATLSAGALLLDFMSSARSLRSLQLPTTLFAMNTIPRERHANGGCLTRVFPARLPDNRMDGAGQSGCICGYSKDLRCRPPDNCCKRRGQLARPVRPQRICHQMRSLSSEVVLESSSHRGAYENSDKHHDW